MRFLKYLTERFYTGAALEKGATSMKGITKEAPALRKVIWKSGWIKEGQTVLDYGAGRHSRNADFLRKKGCKVYAYDPFFNTGNGWDMGTVSTRMPPTNHFDIGFSSFVLNVVPEHIENEIISMMRKCINGTQYHITRNMDIFDTAKNTLTGKTNNKFIKKFFREVFAENEKDIYDLENQTVPDDRIMDFCLFGHETGKDKFQRIPMLEKKGFQKVKNDSKFKIYKK
jgi:hypothetical protein